MSRWISWILGAFGVLKKIAEWETRCVVWLVSVAGSSAVERSCQSNVCCRTTQVHITAATATQREPSVSSQAPAVPLQTHCQRRSDDQIWTSRWIWDFGQWDEQHSYRLQANQATRPASWCVHIDTSRPASWWVHIDTSRPASWWVHTDTSRPASWCYGCVHIDTSPSTSFHWYPNCLAVFTRDSRNCYIAS